MKILASDFDSTIYFPDDLEQNQKNVEAINRFIKSGNIFCVITGRNYSSLKPFLVDNKIFYSYLICEDGAKLFNNMDYSIDTTLLDRDSIEKIVPVLEENHCDYECGIQKSLHNKHYSSGCNIAQKLHSVRGD